MLSCAALFLLFSGCGAEPPELTIHLDDVEKSIEKILETEKHLERSSGLVVATMYGGIVTVKGKQDAKISAELIVISEPRPGAHSMFAKASPLPIDAAMLAIEKLCKVADVEFDQFKEWTKSKEFARKDAMKRSALHDNYAITLEIRNSFNEDKDWHVMITVSQRRK